jgi:small subunit ribosomal protein S16
MLVIRLIRTGKKNAASFRVVLIEKTAPPKSGKFLEMLGNYNPRLNQLSLNKERIKYWLGQGAQASETVHNLLVNEGIVKGPKIKKKFKAKKKKEAPASEGAEAQPSTSEEAEVPVTESAEEKPVKEEEKPIAKETEKEAPQPKEESKEEASENEPVLDKSGKKE